MEKKVVPINEEALFAQYEQAIERLQEKYGSIKLDIHFSDLVAIIGALQLSLRHKEYSERPTAKVVERFVRSVQKTLSDQEPIIGTMIEMGFNPKYDSEIDHHTEEG